eukprot:957541-Pyramimonas_sp.AAC.1
MRQVGWPTGDSISKNYGDLGLIPRKIARVVPHFFPRSFLPGSGRSECSARFAALGPKFGAR